MSAHLPSEPPPVSRPTAGRLNPADAAIWETFVVPRYLSLFGELALEAVVEIDQAQLVHVGCRTGYPDRGLAMKLPNATIVGIDTSPHALALARAKAATMKGMVADYREVEGLPFPLPDRAFSHALALHPFIGRVKPPAVAASTRDSNPGEHAEDTARAMLFAEMKRLLAPSGQLLVAVPLRGSFLEIADLLREFALKFEDTALSLAVDRALALRPTVEMLTQELEEAGFEYIDVSLRPATLGFTSGRDLLEDPLTRLALLPEFRLNLGIEELDRPMAYVREAIDKYWSDGTFQLSVNVGCASARRPSDG